MSVAVQVLGQVDDLLQAARMVADLHRRLELFILALAHLVQLGGQVVELVLALILAQLVIEAVHIAVIVSDEPFLVGLAKVVLLPNADPFKHFCISSGVVGNFTHSPTRSPSCTCPGW